MRIALDARPIFSPHRRGIGKSLLALYQHVAYLRPYWEILAYHRLPGKVRPPIVAQHFHPRFMEMPGDRWNAWEGLRLPLSAWTHRVDLMHCPANSCPRWPMVPVLVTVHDIIPLDEPRYYSADQVQRFEVGVKTACQNAWIMCPSQYTKERLIHRFSADPQRIIVNPWASDTGVKLVEPVKTQKVMNRYSIAPPFVLHLGATDPRKNTRHVIDAWAMLDKAVRNSWELVIIGLSDEMRSELMTAVERWGLESTVQLLGYVKEEELSALMTGADVLAYPSLSEGFGLPVLDAFATDTAVLAANASSIPEVAGDAAVLVDPVDSCAVARGLTKLMRDKRLRETLIEKGRARLEQFTWQTTAARFVQTVERISAGEQSRKTQIAA